MPVTEFTTAELQRTARAVLRAYLDREAGRETAAGLARYLTADAAAALQAQPPHQEPATPFGHAGVGQVSLLRLGPDRAYACAAVPAGHPRAWSVVSVELVAEDDRLRAARVGRVAEASRRAEPAREAPSVGDEQPLPEPPAHLVGLLGALPDSAQARIRWLTAAAVIDTYRERYDIHDPRTALGVQPADAEQRAARARALAYTREVAAQIDRVEPDRPVHGPAREQPSGPELGR